VDTPNEKFIAVFCITHPHSLFLSPKSQNNSLDGWVLVEELRVAAPASGAAALLLPSESLAPNDGAHEHP
jgi:hypothetical protein